ncbi:MAG: hypothetical protein A3H50_01405 [Candidatus Levybacteria bacterium RIFCSPLOWO2_02_FULL_37_10]|nr:MAG: hypothetical protein A2860_03120 [Candidatus Levybacteria bacterium RIFCSPHIGHO2_01_FULL_37_33]OGH43328.1 MAG: hypothetical protein A3H50_01405 [Candidatus Levybacteria bacterium RIFCSPLOWO2_02_FULL_37_10]
MTEGKAKKENKKVLIIIVVMVLALLTGLFYWFQWRPMQIRKECYKLSFGKVEGWIEENTKNYEWAPGKEWHALEGNASGKWGWKYTIPESKETVEYWFKRCLTEKGLEGRF